MNAPKIEHVNLTVRDPDHSARLMEAIFGWRERWRGPALNGGRTIHVGSETDYLALYTDPQHAPGDAYFRKGRPLNHVGVETDDLEGVEARVIAAGLESFNHGDYAPGRRFYFFDPDGIEFEVVSYATRK